MLKRLFLGALIGALLAAGDGAIIGLFVKIFFAAEETWWVVGMWTFYFAIGGAILGGVLGVAWKSLVARLTLRPPTG